MDEMTDSSLTLVWMLLNLLTLNDKFLKEDKTRQHSIKLLYKTIPV